MPPPVTSLEALEMSKMPRLGSEKIFLVMPRDAKLTRDGKLAKEVMITLAQPLDYQERIGR